MESWVFANVIVEPEAKQVIGFLGTWMSLVFEEYRDKLDEERRRRRRRRAEVGRDAGARHGE